jgi:hypothetical protein
MRRSGSGRAVLQEMTKMEALWNAITGPSPVHPTHLVDWIRRNSASRRLQ